MLQSQLEKLVDDRNSLQFQNDSLELDLFNANNNLGRYELGHDFLKEQNPKAHSAMMHFIETQTE